MNTLPIKKRNYSKFNWLGAFAAAALLLLAGCASGPERGAPPAVGTLPDFAWVSSGGRALSIRSFRNQPMVIIVADRANQGNVRKQARNLERVYRDFAGLRTVFIAAFTGESGRATSDVPFAYASDPAAVKAKLGATGNFTIFVVASDGAVAEQSNKVLSGQRVLDIIQNSRPQQLREVR